jgi:hypothetical protein
MKTEYVVRVSYPSSKYPQMDKVIEKAVGYSHGSGMGFGERDHSWYYKTRKAAEKLAEKLNRIKGIDVSPVEEME